MNTIWADRRGARHDSLTTVPDLTAWLRATELAGRSAPVSAADLAQARLLRDALRLLAGVATAAPRQGGGVDGPGEKAGRTTQAAVAAAADVAGEAGVSAAVTALNAIAAAGYSPPRMGVRDGRLIADVAPAGPPVATALSVIAGQAMELLTEPDSPLRACQAPGCVLFFARDHPRREWCSAGCGNRARAARHYRRHRARSQ